MNICVYGASSYSIDPAYIQAGEEFGREMGRRGHDLVFGGGADGMMGAVARGVRETGRKIIGVAPRFFNADGILYEHCDELIRTDTMRERKQIMEDLSEAFVMLPGGIGTYEEFFEILTLKQLARHKKPIALYNIKGYFDPMQAMMEYGVAERFMNEGSMILYLVCDNAGQLLEYLERYEPQSVNPSVLKDLPGNGQRR